MRPVELFQRLQRKFRVARMEEFCSLFQIDEGTRILDVGGTPAIWAALPRQPNVTLINMPRARAEAFSPEFQYVEGDGCCLPFGDRSFDIVFSNSVIEHVGSPEAQQKFASEVARVGKSYWVQTPNRYFPIETHLLTPLVHLLPRDLSVWTVRRFSIWALLNRPAPEEKRWYLDDFIEQIRLLTGRDMSRLFPDASIRSEKFLGINKSWIATAKPVTKTAIESVTRNQGAVE